MGKKKIRVGLIGCGGNMRNAHVPRLQADGAIDLVAAADPVEAQAQALEEKWGRPFSHYADYRRMIAEQALDAVLVSSPHATHYAQVRLALKAGLHVLVEKPLTISSRDSKALIKLAAESGLFLQVSYQRNYYAPHRYVRQLIQQGKIGSIAGVVAYVTQNWGRAGGWRLVPELAGGGMFMDTGSHLVASVLWMTGLQPEEVSAFMEDQGKPVDINAVVNLRFKGGALGSINTLGGASRHDERLAIHGTAGCIVFHLHQWQVKAVTLNDEALKVPAGIKADSPDAAFFRWIRFGGKDYEAPDYALQVARLSEAAYRSVQEKRPIRVRR